MGLDGVVGRVGGHEIEMGGCRPAIGGKVGDGDSVCFRSSTARKVTIRDSSLHSSCPVPSCSRASARRAVTRSTRRSIASRSARDTAIATTRTTTSATAATAADRAPPTIPASRAPPTRARHASATNRACQPRSSAARAAAASSPEIGRRPDAARGGRRLSDRRSVVDLGPHDRWRDAPATVRDRGGRRCDRSTAAFSGCAVSRGGASHPRSRRTSSG